MKVIFNLKPWVVFTFVFMLPLIGNIMSPFVSDNFMVPTLVRMLGVILYFFWLAMIGFYLDRMNRYSKKPFRYLFFTALNVCAFTYISMHVQQVLSEKSLALTIFQMIAIPFTVFGFFYNCFFVARTFRSIELNREAKISECIGETFLMVIWPIGIWSLLPRMQRGLRI